MSTATKGRAFEHQIKKLLEANGFSVMRGAGSKGEMLRNKVDLIATKLTTKNKYNLLIHQYTFIDVQCKVKKIKGFLKRKEK